MAKKELVFKDLIFLLKDIDSMDELPNNLFDELLNAALAVGLNKLAQSNRYTELEALDFLQRLIVAHLEGIKEDKS